MYGASEYSMACKGSARKEPGTDLQGLRRDVQQMMRESQAFLMDAMKNMMADFTRSNRQSEPGDTEKSAAVGEREPCRGRVGQRPHEIEEGSQVYMMETDKICEHWDGEMLLQSRLARRGISQTTGRVGQRREGITPRR